MSKQGIVSRIFGNNAIDWLDSAYAVDWIIVAAVWTLSWLALNVEVFERDFHLDDPLISFPHKHNQVGSTFNQGVALFIPIVIVVCVGLLQRSLIEIHHGLISIFAGRGLTQLVTTLMKHKVGRLRPDFLARCRWDQSIKACAGSLQDVLDGRKSFPSGHSSAAWAGMTFMSFWIANKTAAWCFSAPIRAATYRSSRLGRFFLTLIPMSWATFVAISRIEDYRHHKEDVIAGAIIGIVSAIVCYLIFWSNPFSANTFKNHISAGPRVLYIADENGSSRNVEFELHTRLEDDETVV